MNSECVAVVPSRTPATGVLAARHAQPCFWLSKMWIKNAATSWSPSQQLQLLRKNCACAYALKPYLMYVGIRLTRQACKLSSCCQDLARDRCRKFTCLTQKASCAQSGRTCHLQAVVLLEESTTEITTEISLRAHLRRPHACIIAHRQVPAGTGS